MGILELQNLTYSYDKKRKVLRGINAQMEAGKMYAILGPSKDDLGRLLCGAGVGITGNMMERVDALVKAHVDVIVVDSAHGHSRNILEAVKKIKAAYPDLQVIAGNVATGAATRDLIKAGADAVKVGICPVQMRR